MDTESYDYVRAMVTLKRKFVTVGELWFDERPAEQPADVHLYYHWSEPVSGGHSKDFYSVEIPLIAAPQELLAAMKKDTRYEIARADKKDGLTFAFWSAPDNQILDNLCVFFDAFAASRGLSPANRSWLNAYAHAGHLAISCISQDVLPLVWHVYYRGGTWARLLMSASDFRSNPEPSFRNLVGRGNRYLHWRDMLQFKESGVSFYDMGGWYEGAQDAQKLRINQFKEEFGGAVTRRYYCMRALTAKGRMFLWANAKARPQERFLHMA